MWFSGFIDSDGSIYIDEKSRQLIISVTQKNKYLLEPLQKIYGGIIFILSSREAFQYSVYRKDEILKLVNNYFYKYPLKSGKAHKLNLIKDFYLLMTDLKCQSLSSDLRLKRFKQWLIFKDKWEKS